MTTFEELLQSKNKGEEIKKLAKMREELPPGEPPEPKPEAKSLGAAAAKEKSAENKTKEKIFKERVDKMFVSVFSSIKEEVMKKAFRKGTEEEKNSRLQQGIEKIKSDFLEFSGNETNAYPSLGLNDKELELEILRFCAEKGETENKALKKIIIDKFGKGAKEAGSAVETEIREEIKKEGEQSEKTTEKPESEKPEQAISFQEFLKKYGSVFKANLFDREGNWIYISSYSEKTGKSRVFSSKKGSKEKESGFLTLEELDKSLADYKKPARKIENPENIKTEEELKEGLTGIETEENLLDYLKAMGECAVVTEKDGHFYFPAHIKKVEKVLSGKLSWNDIRIPILRNKIKEIIQKREGEKKEPFSENIPELSGEELEKRAVKYFIPKAREFVNGISDEGKINWENVLPQEKKNIVMNLAQAYLRGLLKGARGIKEEKIENIISVIITQI